MTGEVGVAGQVDRTGEVGVAGGPVTDTTAPSGGLEPAATGTRHAVVVGMHRSGTSSVAHALVELGLGLPRAMEIIGPEPTNERGHWEGRGLVRFNDAVLDHLGGTWSAPPVTAPGWPTADDPAWRQLRVGAEALAARSLADPPMVLKDPRLCLTLPLWRSVLGAEPCAVLVLRDPLDVARSLERRNALPLTLGLALWERYVRHAVAVVDGMPVLVLEYEAALDRPERSVADMADFLGGCGITVPSTRLGRAAAVFTHELRHHRSDGDTDGTLAPHQRRLLDALRATTGAHQCWTRPDLPDEPGWVDDVIGLARTGHALDAARERAEHELTWIKRSRVFRAVAALWRLTGTGPHLTPEAGPVSGAGAEADDGGDAVTP